MLYAVVEDGHVVKQASRPKWFTDEGPVSDADLIAEGVYPVLDDVPSYNPVTHHVVRADPDQWVVGDDKVEVVYEVVENSPETIKQIFSQAIQNMLDEAAQSRRYDSGTTISTYVNSNIPAWAAEAQAFVAWLDAVWAYAYTELERVETGQREIPTVEDLLAELPEISWPE